MGEYEIIYPLKSEFYDCTVPEEQLHDQYDELISFTKELWSNQTKGFMTRKPTEHRTATYTNTAQQPLASPVPQQPAKPVDAPLHMHV